MAVQNFGQPFQKRLYYRSPKIWSTVKKEIKFPMFQIWNIEEASPSFSSMLLMALQIFGEPILVDIND